MRRGEERDDLSDLLTRATVGAAWACIRAILPVAFASEDPSSAVALLDIVMGTMRPAGRPSGRGSHRHQVPTAPTDA
ncbi:MAG TPA: hypothetical protein VME46_09780 [Acidimicrobiales bacterium]|nr:hypothetical protein [Acidimicrobiales bacterium]